MWAPERTVSGREAHSQARGKMCEMGPSRQTPTGERQGRSSGRCESSNGADNSWHSSCQDGFLPPCWVAGADKPGTPRRDVGGLFCAQTGIGLSVLGSVTAGLIQLVESGA